MSNANKINSDDLDFSEFVQYMINHDNKLELVFKGIDIDNDSNILLLITIK
jgi:hypothetical protein